MKTIIHRGELLIILCIGLMPQTLSGQADGEALFQKQNCSACHTINGGKLIGPDLTNITNLRDRQWLISFIKSPDGMINKGDTAAIRIYNEYSKIMMPDNNIPDSDIEAIIDYISAMSGNAQKDTSQQQPEIVSFSPFDAEAGVDLFSGDAHFSNNGPSCITCHHISNQNDFSGGNLAVDLTNSFEKLGMNGIKAVLKNPAFPVMKAAYKNVPLTETEIVSITAYLQNVSMNSEIKPVNLIFRTTSQIMVTGISALIIVMIIIVMIWSGRKDKSVNESIFKRQLKTE